MREVRPLFAIMISLYMYVFDYFTIGESIIKSFYDIVRRISTAFNIIKNPVIFAWSS
jgi:hypothetical protein